MNEKLYQLSGVLAIVLLALAYLALRSWRGRVAGQQKLVGELASPFTFSEPTEFEAFYVATTVASEPLNRVAAAGLAHRGNAIVFTGKEGLGILRQGEQDLWLPAERILSISTVSATIDKAVESNGLVCITWQATNGDLETQLRMQSSADQRAFLDLTNKLFSRKGN